MKISLNWLKQYVDINIPNDELIRLIGARLVEVEGVVDETHKYDNISVVKITTCEAIEGTHLHLCQIDTGSQTVQVVCGAPNVHAGMLAAWIAPGAIVPQSVHDTEPFVIGARKMLKTYDSFGMLASAAELDFGDDHSGIVEIDPHTAKPGDKLADIFALNDIILDIENKSLTHRPDCFGIIGFAREVAGILDQPFNEPKTIFETTKISDDSASLAVDIDGKICPRYSAKIIKLEKMPSKPYLTIIDTLLAKSGMRSVDPIVDLTNYLMLLTGQPLHAFDYDKFVQVGNSKTPKIIVRLAEPKEKLVLLDGTEIILNESDIVITSNDIPVALAGAMGGESTKIDDSTTKIILESATFNISNMRKTQMSHGIFSEAINRFTKGQPASQTAIVAATFAEMLPNSIIIGEADAYPVPAKSNVVKITTQEINQLLGTNFTTPDIVRTLQNVGFQIDANKDSLVITAPVYRSDINIKEDIIEEIGRLNGYDNIEPVLPLHATAVKNPLFELKKSIRSFYSNRGANEILTYSFISEDLLKKANQDPTNSYKIINSISPDLQYFRQSLIPNLLEKTYINLKVPYDNFALFEMNQVYQKSYGLDADGVPNFRNKLAFVVASRKGEFTAYYKAKFYLEKLFAHFGLNPQLAAQKIANTNSKIFEPKRAADIMINNTYIGTIGELRKSIARDFKLPVSVAVFEIDLDELLLAVQNTKHSLKTFFFNKSERDLTIATTKSYAEVFKQITTVIDKYNLDYKIAPTAIYQPEGVKLQKISFHLTLSNLPTDQIQKLMQELEKIA